MLLRNKLATLSLAFLGLICESASGGFNGFSEKDGAFYTDDAVIVNAAVSRMKRDVSNSTRNGRQLILLRQTKESDDILILEPTPDSYKATESQVFSFSNNETSLENKTVDSFEDQTKAQTEGAFGLDCETTLGKRGTCKSFHDCYPLLKVADLSGSNGWVMGHYDTCSYISGDNMEVFGVCCTEPVGTPPQQEPDVQRLGLLPQVVPAQTPPLAYQGFPGHFASYSSQWQFDGANARQIPAQWPPTIPPLPTHPPDHSAPTHPPSLGGTTKPPTQTTWATRPPATTQATTKQSWPPSYPTQPTRPTSAPAADGSCGMKNGYRTYEALQDEERIVGGHNADLNEWPWIVALFNGGRQFCGGSLIDDRHVLSAAHCVAHMTSWDVARLTARIADHNIHSNTETQHIERKIKRVVRHRGFDMRTLYNDVAILTLDQPVPFTKTSRPVCLPGGGRAYSGQIGTVIGWGSLREAGPQPSVLQEVSIPIWTNQECRLKYGAAAPGGIVDHMLCAGKASMDSCSGDSGGPLMVNEGGRWTQVGVVSWGIGCGKGHYPGVYTRVTAFLPWIQKNSK